LRAIATGGEAECGQLTVNVDLVASAQFGAVVVLGVLGEQSFHLGGIAFGAGVDNDDRDGGQSGLDRGDGAPVAHPHA
jgi:hypothetical protein